MKWKIPSSRAHIYNRILGLTLAGFILLSIMAVSPWAAGGKIDGYNSRTLEDMYVLGQSGSDPWDIRVKPGDEIRIPLTADMFTWSDDRVPGNMEALTTNQLASGRVKVKFQKLAGTKTLDYVQFDTDTFDDKYFLRPGLTTRTGRTAYISVMFSREFVSTEELDFTYVLYLSIDGYAPEELSIVLSGTMMVDEHEVDRDTDYIDMSEGAVVEATEYVPNLDMDLGNGLTLHARLYEKGRYYAICKIVDSREQMEDELAYLPQLYPEIQLIYKLETAHSNGPGFTAGTTAELAPPNDESVYHVYSEDLQYLGTTKDKVAFSPMYILTSDRVPQLETITYVNVTSNAVEVVESDDLDEFGTVSESSGDAQYDKEGVLIFRNSFDVIGPGDAALAEESGILEFERIDLSSVQDGD